MSIAALLNRPCTITRVTENGAADIYGNPTQATTTVDTLCYLEQRARTEDTVNATLGDEEWLVMLPTGTTIDDTDRVTVDGVTYEVNGPPWPVWNPRTQSVSHVELRARRTA